MTDPLVPEFSELDGVYPARQTRSRIAQERLLEAAETVFASHGYHGAHITEIAATAGYSIGAFYLRFRDKDAVFRALRRRFATRGRKNIERFFAQTRWATDTPSLLIQAYVEETWRVMLRNAGFFRALYQRSLDGEADEDWLELRVGTEMAGGRLAAHLRRHAPHVDRPDLETFCTFCLGAVDGTMIHRLLNPSARHKTDTAFFQASLTLMATSCLGLPQQSGPRSAEPQREQHKVARAT